MKRFLSGDEALAEGVRLARPQVISAYPITPQTVVVERLSEMVEDGSLDAEYVHVESEHSATATSATRSLCSTMAGSRCTPKTIKRRLTWLLWPMPWPRTLPCARR